jgi:dTDP-glucose 4,6-dehydratase
VERAQPKTILVTGGCGFIGSSFVRQAAAVGHRIVVLDALTYAGHRENLTGALLPGRVDLVEGNICNGPLIQELLGLHRFDTVINFAAESHVDRSIHSPGEFIQTNIQGTYTLLQVCHGYWQTLPKTSSFRYLQVSTDEVYGSLGPEGKFSETTPYAPNSPYSASKAAGDFLVRAWFHTFGFPGITTNCSNNYGPRQFPEKLIPHMIACALQGKPLPVYGDGKNIRDWIHVEDHCRGILLALEKGRPGLTYCFGGNAERDNLQVVKSICRHLDRLRPRPQGSSYEKGIQFVTDRLGHDRRYAIDDRFAQKELGFTREYDFETGLAQTVGWYLDNEAWSKAVLEKRK